MSTSTVEQTAYHLSDAQLEQLEAATCSHVRQLDAAASGIVALVVSSDHELADFGRTSESRAFKQFEDYDFHAGMAPYESRSEFVLSVDLGNNVVAHTKRIVSPLSATEIAAAGLTGIEPIDDRLGATDADEAASLDGIVAFHGIDDLGATINIATNQNTRRGIRGFPYVALSYKAIFSIIDERRKSHLFAYMNPVAIESLMGSLGIEHELLGGREFHLPLPDGSYDENYIAVCLPATEENKRVFTHGRADKPNSQILAQAEVPVLYA